MKGAPMKEGLLMDDLEVGTLVQQPPPASLLHHGNHGNPDHHVAAVVVGKTPPQPAPESPPVAMAAAQKKASGVVHFAAGGIGGMAGALVTCPLEVVKTRMQSSLYTQNPRKDLQKYGPPMPPQPPVVSYPRSGAVLVSKPVAIGIGGTSPSFHSISGASVAVDPSYSAVHLAPPVTGQQARTAFSYRPVAVVYDLFAKPIEMMASIYRNEGLAALWKGLGPNLVGIVPSRAIYFGTYSQGKTFLMELNGGKENSKIHLAAAACAGITVATVTCPIWVVKTRMQLQSTAQKQGPKPGDAIPYKNSIDCVKRIVLEEGAKGLYKGLGASYLGVIESTVQFVLYEKMKLSMRAYRAEKPSTVLPPHVQEWADYFCIAAGAKLFAALLTYPHEVVRTRMREVPVPGKVFKYSSVKNTIQVVLKEEGIAPLYGGLGAHLLRVVPNAAIMFLGYELVVRLCEK